jgi:hypothetical protein
MSRGLAFGWCDRDAVCVDSVLEESFHTVQHLLLSLGRMHGTTKFGAVPDAMSEPARELFHFANTIGEVGSGNFMEIARE